MTLDDMIKDFVLKTLCQCTSRNEAAKILGISKKTLFNYLKKWNIPKDKDQEESDYLKYGYRTMTASQRDRFENMEHL